MPAPFRIATFNCENLFSRPKVFDQSATKSNVLLGQIAELTAALHEDVYDHAKIADLEKKVGGFASVNDLRNNHTKVTGAKDWTGTVELTRGDVKDAAVENTGRVIADIDADLICLIEVENRTLLQKFHDDVVFGKFLKAKSRPGYERVILVDGNDDRGIDVSFMCRLPIRWLRTHIHERTTYNGRDVALFSRDCLEVEVELQSGQVLHLLINHFKSMGYSPPNDPLSNRRRLAQAQRVKELALEHDLQNELVVVAGDLNSDPASPSLAPLVTEPGLYNANLELAVADRATYHTGNKQIDFLFLSQALRSKLTGVRVERRGMFTTKWPHYPEVISDRTSASDHAAVVADFMI